MARPTVMPAMIDSHGKPGIPGRATGVTTELDEVACVVGVVTIVVDDAERVVGCAELVWEVASPVVDELSCVVDEVSLVVDELMALLLVSLVEEVVAAEVV
jgi:hypothetical protein